MNSKRLAKSTKIPTRACKTPSPRENVFQSRLRHKRQQTEASPTDSVVILDQGTDLDLIDLINGDLDRSPDPVNEDVGKAPEELKDAPSTSEDEDAESALDHSFESTASGPCLPCFDPPVLQGSSPAMCPVCLKLYKKAQKMKKPIKDKILDNDPTSLTCDQWVLKKRRRLKKLHNVKGKLWTHLRLIKTHLSQKQCMSHDEEQVLSACSRPHAFLTRNLRRCTQVSVKVKRRKRARRNSPHQRLAKQRRRHDSGHSEQSLQSDALLTAGAEVSDEDGSLEQNKIDLAVEVIPCSVTMAALPVTVPKEPRKKSGFRDLLVQLRGNSNMIVKEPHL